MNAELNLESNPVNIDQLDTAKPLDVIFSPAQTVLEKWEAKVSSLVVTDISQKTEMAQARLARLELKEARCTLEKTRKGLVEGLKARTSKIDSAARTIREKMEELEAKLKESEEFAERHAAKVKADLRAKREAELKPLLDTPIFIDLSELSEEAYVKALEDAQLLRKTKIEAAEKAEAERKAKAEAERIERERIAAENARLKAEMAEAARVAEEERKRVEAERAEERRKAEAEAARLEEIARKEREAAAKEAAKLKAELEAKEKAEAERKAKEAAAAEAERKRVEEEKKAEEKARKAAAAAPDTAKLKAFSSLVMKLEVPELNNADVHKQVKDQVAKFSAWIESQIQKL